MSDTADPVRDELVRAASLGLHWVETLCVEYVKPGCLREKQCHHVAAQLRKALAAQKQTEEKST